MRNVSILALALAVTACEPVSVIEPEPTETLDAQLRQSLEVWGVMPIGNVQTQNAAMVDLGQSLFFDKILSGNRDISCGSCHLPEIQMMDGMSLAIGTGGSATGTTRTLGAGRQFVPRNAPALMNQGLGFFYTLWDGRVNEEGGPGFFRGPAGIVFPQGLRNLVAAQAMLPVLNRVEMRGNVGDTDVNGNSNELAAIADSSPTQAWRAIMTRLLAIQAYQSKFNAAFPGVPTTQLGFQHAANAIAAFEVAKLTATNSPFDQYLRRDNGALTDEQKRGGILFFGKARCNSCHSGALLGGQQFANIGIPQIGPGVGAAAPLDVGRAEHIPVPPGAPPNSNSFYRFTFRVPALRNVELTAPYMHNGAFRTLETVVRHYTNADSSLRNYDPTQLDPAVRPLYRGDLTTINDVAKNLDFRLTQGSFQPGSNGRIQLTATEQKEIVAFLKSLTDPAVMNLGGIVPASVPSGLPVRN